MSEQFIEDEAQYNWENVVADMQEWHPDLQHHVKKYLAQNGMQHLLGDEADMFAPHDVEPGSESSRDDTARNQAMEGLKGYYSVYENIASKINALRPEKGIKIGSFEEMKSEFVEWLTPDRVRYMQLQRAHNPALEYIFTAVPNTPVSAHEITVLARDFGHRLRGKPGIIEEDFLKRYSPEQLSGTDKSNGRQFLFSAIPFSEESQHRKFDKPDHGEDRIYGRGEQLNQLLGSLQAEYPFMKVPSVLEGIAMWNILEASGVPMYGEDTIHRTETRQINLPIFDGHQPFMFVTSRGSADIRSGNGYFAGGFVKFSVG